MERFNCLVIEDEPLAAEILEDYIAQVPFLKMQGCSSNAIFALERLQQQDIDVVFLDIHLPKMKGLDFLRTLRDPPKVIVTTAYQEYALQGYELNVVDYLLKPIEFSRFLMAVNKLRIGAGSRSTEWMAKPESERSYLYFNVHKKQVKIYLDEVLYVESLREYVRIITPDKTIMTKLQLGEVEEMLGGNNFLRVHRSFIVSRRRVDAFSATEVEVGGKQIPIGRNYKEAVLAAL